MSPSVATQATYIPSHPLLCNMVLEMMVFVLLAILIPASVLLNILLLYIFALVLVHAILIPYSPLLYSVFSAILVLMALIHDANDIPLSWLSCIWLPSIKVCRALLLINIP